MAMSSVYDPSGIPASLRARLIDSPIGTTFAGASMLLFRSDEMR